MKRNVINEIEYVSVTGRDRRRRGRAALNRHRHDITCNKLSELRNKFRYRRGEGAGFRLVRLPPLPAI